MLKQPLLRATRIGDSDCCAKSRQNPLRALFHCHFLSEGLPGSFGDPAQAGHRRVLSHSDSCVKHEILDLFSSSTPTRNTNVPHARFVFLAASKQEPGGRSRRQRCPRGRGAAPGPPRQPPFRSPQSQRLNTDPPRPEPACLRLRLPCPVSGAPLRSAAGDQPADSRAPAEGSEQQSRGRKRRGHPPGASAPPGLLTSPRRAGDEGAGGGEPPSAAASRLP